jgi:hypothetical protein
LRAVPIIKKVFVINYSKSKNCEIPGYICIYQK